LKGSLRSVSFEDGPISAHFFFFRDKNDKQTRTITETTSLQQQQQSLPFTEDG
jgi:hypothetical protein